MVGPNGLIFNNSAQAVLTQLGGWAHANGYLKPGQEAKSILAQVTSTRPSYLNGYIEVAGAKADVIIANPNGITCAGCGFINTTRSLVTTGTPNYNYLGGLESFRVIGGEIRIDGTGLQGATNATTLERVDVLARSVAINAGIWAKHLNIVTGTNEVGNLSLKAQPSGANGIVLNEAETVADQALTITPLAASTNAPLLALDVAALGGMYANKIRLIGTESGVGVNMAGYQVASGDFTIDVNGKLQHSGRSDAGGQLFIQTTGAIENSGSLYAHQGVGIKTAQSLNNEGKIYSDTQLALKAQSGIGNGVQNGQKAEIASANAQAVTLDAGQGALVNQGQIYSDAALTVKANGVTQGRTGMMKSQATLSLEGGSGAINTSGYLIAKNDLIVGTVGDIHLDDVQAYSGGNMTVSGQVVSAQRSHVQVDQALSLRAAAGAALDNSEWLVLGQGRLEIEQALSSSGFKWQSKDFHLKANGWNMNAGELVQFGGGDSSTIDVGTGQWDSVNGKVVLSARQVEVKGAGWRNGSLTSYGQGPFSVTLVGDLISEKLFDARAQRLQITAAQWVNKGLMNHTGEELLLTANTLDNHGTRSAGNGFITAGQFNWQGQVFNNREGRFQVGGATITLNRLDNGGGQIVASEQLLRLTTDRLLGLERTGDGFSAIHAVLADIWIKSGAQLEGGAESPDQDIIQASRALKLRIDGDVINDGEISANGTGFTAAEVAARALSLDVLIQGNLDNRGNISSHGIGQLIVTGDIRNQYTDADKAVMNGQQRVFRWVNGIKEELSLSDYRNQGAIIKTDRDTLNQDKDRLDTLLQTYEQTRLTVQLKQDRLSGLRTQLTTQQVALDSATANLGYPEEQLQELLAPIQQRQYYLQTASIDSNGVSSAETHADFAARIAPEVSQLQNDLNQVNNQLNNSTLDPSARDNLLLQQSQLETQLTQKTTLQTDTAAWQSALDHVRAERAVYAIAEEKQNTLITQRNQVEALNTEAATTESELTQVIQAKTEQEAVLNPLQQSYQSRNETLTQQESGYDQWQISGNAVKNRRGMIGGDELLVKGASLNNYATIMGQSLTVEAQQITNDGAAVSNAASDKNNSGYASLVGIERLNVIGEKITNKGAGTIYSTDRLSIGGGVVRDAAGRVQTDANGMTQLSGRARHLVNESSLLASRGDMQLSADKIDNKKRLIEVSSDFRYDMAFKAGEDAAEAAARTAAARESSGSWTRTYETYIVKNSVAAEITSQGNLWVSSDRFENSNSKVGVGQSFMVNAQNQGSSNQVIGSNNSQFINSGTQVDVRTETHSGRGWHTDHYTCDFRVSGFGFSYCAWGHWYSIHHEGYQLDNQTPSQKIVDIASVVANQAVVLNVGDLNNVTPTQNVVPGETIIGGAVAAPKTSTAGLPAYTMPKNALYQNASPRKPYLIEGNPRFTDEETFLGSDYLLKLLASDPSKLQKRLGDGWVEQRRIEEQLLALAGKPNLQICVGSGGQNVGCADSNALSKALYSNGAEMSKSLELTLGKGLTARQQANLTKPMVWMEEQEVLLGDGSRVMALAPKVYLPLGSKEGLAGDYASVIKGSQVKVSASGTIKNSGGAIGGRN